MGNWFSFQAAPQQIAEEYFEYIKVPLDPARKEIRLIKLNFPGDDDALVSTTIECTMKSFPLDECPAYIPFSYVWGSGKRLPIRCNGSQLDILPNLYDALQEYRTSFQFEAWIWADAICINQDDKTEKSWQILLMREIYERGIGTWIWLGRADKRMVEGFGLLITLLFVRDKRTEKNDNRPFSQMSWEEMEELGLPHPIISSAYKSLSLLLSRPWFSRVWVIQELALSRNAIVQCGPYTMLWQTFIEAVQYGYEIHIPILTNTKFYQSIYEMEIFRLKRQDGERVNLLLLLMLGRSRHVTERKDKVYALCGLADDVGSDHLDINPEYSSSVSVEEVYRAVAEKILRKNSSLDLLSVPRLTHNPKSQLPTWVPDWSDTEICAGILSPGAPEPLAYKHWATPAELPSAISFSEDGTICLSGHIVDGIESIGPKWTDEKQDTATILSVWLNYIPREQAVLNDWEKICQLQANQEYTPTKERIADAYWQTLIAGNLKDITGNLEDGFDATKQRYEKYDDCIRSRFRVTSPLIPRWLGFLIVIIRWLIEIIRSPKASQELISQSESIMSFRWAMTAAKSRRMFRSSRGYIGLAPALAQKGDQVVLVQGGQIPLILRRVQNNRKWNLIGDCYVHGIMKGEGFSREKCHDILIC